MRKLLIVFLSVLGFNNVSAQDNHFVYIQSENHKPFYLRINSKLYRASGDGYLLVPGLSKSNYQLYIALDNPPAPEWKFNCEVSNEDLAYTLKSSSKGLELVPLGSSGNVSGIKEEPKPEKNLVTNKTPVLAGPASEDAFSMMLSGVVNDPTIREQTALIQKESLVVVKEAPPEKPIKTAAPVPEQSVAETTQKKTTDSTKVATASFSDDLIAGLSKKDNTAAAAVDDVKKQPQKTNDIVANPKPPVENTVVKEQATPDRKIAETKDASIAETKPEVVAEKPASTPGSNETFVIKETKSAPNKAAPGQTGVTKPDTKPDTDSQFVIKEVKISEKKKQEAAASIPETAPNNPVTAPKNTNEPFVIKEVTAATKKENDNATAKNNSATAAINATPSEDKPFVIKETTVANNKPVVDNKTEQPVTDKPATGSQPFVIKEAVTAPIIKTSGGVSASIKKTLQRRSADGIELIYVDENTDGSKDTIRILIPAK